MRTLSRPLMKMLRTNTLGNLSRAVLLGGFQYGRLGDVMGLLPFSAVTPRPSFTSILTRGSFAWRTLSAALSPEIGEFGEVTEVRDRGAEFDFTWVPANIETTMGKMAQLDAQYVAIDPDVPSTCEHGLRVDSVLANISKNRDGASQVIASGLGTIASTTWTLSCSVAGVDLDGVTAALPASVRLTIQRSAGVDSGTATPAYTAIGKYQRLTLTKTFDGTAGTSFQIVIGASVGTLITEVQIEQAGAATSYERTGATVGTKNKVLHSHFIGTSPWTTQVTAGQTVTVTVGAGRGPENRFANPNSPGYVDFGIGYSAGISLGDGLIQLTPYDEYGQTADTITSTAIGRSGPYDVIGGSGGISYGKTYIASGWVRHTGATIPTTVGIMLSPWDAGSVHLYDDIGPEFAPTKHWRRIWWATYVDASYTTAIQMEAFFFMNDAASGKTVDWFGLQLEELSGDTIQLPRDYQATSGAAGSYNILPYSSDLTNGAWSKAGCTVAGNTSYAPIEYYDVTHPDKGVAGTRLRVNPRVNPSADWEFPETYLNSGDNLFGGAFSMGAYGADVFAGDGDFVWPTPTTITGWTLGGTTANLTKAAALPEYWIDDEEASAAGGVKVQTTGGSAIPLQYISKTVALTAGWHTLRIRGYGQGTPDQSAFYISLLRSTDSKYMDKDCARFRSSSEIWVKPMGRNIGYLPPSMGLAVWHFCAPTTTNYTLKIGAEQLNAAPARIMRFDQARLYANGGAVYASPTDRTDTAGTSAQLLQGLNVLFRGIVDDTIDGSEDTLRVRCKDYVTGTDQVVPSKTARAECQVTFRGALCGYVSTTFFTANSVATTGPHTVDNITRVVVGRYITDRLGTGVGGKVMTINVGAKQFTTDVAMTFNINDLFRYADCRHVYPDCSIRQRTHMYLGARASMMQQAMLGGISYMRAAGPPASKRSDDSDAAYQLRRTAAELVPSITASGQDFLNDKVIFDSRSVPLVLGRKSVMMIPIESHAIKYATDSTEYLVAFYAMAWGKVDGPRLGIPGITHPFFTKDGPIIHNMAGGVGVYWRDGSPGADNWWTLANHAAALTTQKIPNQFRDFRTNTDNAYPHWAYAILQIKKGNPLVDLNDPARVPELWVDMNGLLCQKYDANGVPQGAKVFTRNPIWQMIEVLRDTTFGPGLPISVFHWSTLKAKADECDTQITSSALATVRTAATGAAVIEVDSVDGFAPEMEVLHNGSTSRTVKMIDPIAQRLVLSSGITVVVGDTFQGRPARYTCDLAITKQIGVGELIDKILNTCRGQLVFQNGKISVATDQPTTPSNFLLKTPTDITGGAVSSSSYLGIIPKTIKFDTRRGSKNTYNAVEITYESSAILTGAGRVLRFADADRGGLDAPRTLKITLEGVDTADQALRCALPILARKSAAVGPASEEAVGFTVESGIPAVQMQLGDIVSVQRPNRTPLTGAKISTLRIQPDLKVEIKCEPESRNFRADGFLPQFSAYSDNPTSGIRGEVGTQIALATLTLTITQQSAGRLKALFTVAGYTAGPGTSAGLNLQRFVGFELHASLTAAFTPTSGAFGMGGTLVAQLDATAREFDWAVPDALLEVPLYLKLAGLPGAVGVLPTYSSEVSTSVFYTDRPTSDPTQQEGSHPTNMVYGGDFNAPADWLHDDAATTYPGTFVAPTVIEAPVVPSMETTLPAWTITENAALTETAVAAATANIGKITDALDTTYYGYASTFNTTPNPDALVFGSFAAYNFGAGANVVGRPYVRVANLGGPSNALGVLRLYYNQDVVGTPTAWVFMGSYAPTIGVFTDIPGPEVIATDLSKFGIGVSIIASQHFTAATTRTWTGRVYKVAFEQKAAAAYAGAVSGNEGVIYGDGSAYGNLRRPFPGQAPVGNQVAFNASTLNHVRVQLKKQNSGDTLDGNAVEIRIYDANSPSNEWALASIPSSEITGAWQDFAIKFTSANQIVGNNLHIEIRTKNTKAIKVDKLLVARGDTLFAWTTSPENQGEGYFGDFSNGEASGFTKGSWVAGDRKKSPVA